MTKLASIIEFLDRLAPPSLAEDWDNVGLLVGDRNREVSSIVTCLTLTPDVAEEAVREGAQLVVTHHPLMFRPVQRITADAVEGRLLLQLIEAGIAVYSPHTGYDSAAGGINRQLAELLELQNVGVLRPATIETEPSAATGGGRFGSLASPVELGQFVDTVKRKLRAPGIQFVGDTLSRVERVAIACGSAAEFLPDARQHGCDVLLTGEARFHACLEARAAGIALILAGHYTTERPGIENLAALLSQQFPQLRIWPSKSETDPIQWR